MTKQVTLFPQGTAHQPRQAVGQLLLQMNVFKDKEAAA